MYLTWIAIIASPLMGIGALLISISAILNGKGAELPAGTYFNV